MNKNPWIRLTHHLYKIWISRPSLYSRSPCNKYENTESIRVKIRESQIFNDLKYSIRPTKLRSKNQKCRDCQSNFLVSLSKSACLIVQNAIGIRPSWNTKIHIRMLRPKVHVFLNSELLHRVKMFVFRTQRQNSTEFNPFQTSNLVERKTKSKLFHYDKSFKIRLTC